jgi:hypothetical protein
VRITCAECGQKLEQPSNGRPRQICDNHECARLRRKKRELTWAEEDFPEGVENWHDACAFCGDGGPLFPSIHHLPPVPACHACYHDAARQLRAPPAALKRLAYYCANAHRGVPLPRPFVFELEREW